MIKNNITSHSPRKIILLLDLSESYSRRLVKGLIKFSDMNEPWSFCKLPPSFKEKNGMDTLLKFIRDWKADAILGQFNSEQEINLLLNEGVRVISMDYKMRFDEVSNITGDYLLSGKMAAEHFISKGYNYFGYYGFNQTVWSKERFLGFKSTLDHHKKSCSTYIPEENEFSEIWYFKPSPLVRWLKSFTKPFAIFASDDNGAEHILQAAKQAELNIPEDLSILGVDNDEMVCNMSYITLSSIEQDEENAGFKAGALFNKMFIENKNIKSDIQVKPLHVVKRQSTDIYTMPDTRVSRALVFIDNNLNKELTVNQIANHVALSRRALEKRFSKAVGRSIYESILKKRVEKVTNLLVNTNLSVEEIAVLSGFPDNKNMSRTFKKFHQTTPLRFRKEHKPLH